MTSHINHVCMGIAGLQSSCTGKGRRGQSTHNLALIVGGFIFRALATQRRLYPLRAVDQNPDNCEKRKMTSDKGPNRVCG